MGTWELSVQLDKQSYRDARDNGSALYGVSGVGVGSGHGRPLVWFAATRYGMINRLRWSAACETYIAQRLEDDEPISAYDPYDLQLGGQLTVIDDSGEGQIGPGRDNTLIAVVNERQREFSVGLTGRAPITHRFAPICTVPLIGHGTVNLRPAARIALFFSPTRFADGLPLDRAPAPTVIVELARAAPQQVSYNTETGWSWLAAARGISVIKAGDNLAGRLVTWP